jgi:hypothetical protein
MARLIFLKLSSMSALIASASLLSGCGTSFGRPEICKTDPGNERCSLVPHNVAATGMAKAGGGRNY